MASATRNTLHGLLAITIVFMLAFFWHRNVKEFSNLSEKLHFCRSHVEQTTHAAGQKPPSELQLKINEIFQKIEQSLPNATVGSNWKTSTSGKNSKGTIVNHKDQYCVGEVLTVQYDMFDHLGNRKTYGGDFLRPRIFSPELNAGASGRIEDFHNGTYHIHFTLFWEGNVKVSTHLFHPSEGVAALWRSRHSSLGVLAYQGRFQNANTNTEAITECGFKLKTDSEVCEYIDERDEEAFYCIKPPNLPCGSLNDMRSVDLHSSYLTAEEQHLFERSNIGVEIPKNFEFVVVQECNGNISKPTEKCKTGMVSPYPSGYFLQNIWHPVFCNMVSYKTGEDYLNCLQRKRLYLIGDSTLRQYIMYFAEQNKLMTYFDHHESGWSTWQKTLLAFHMDKDIMVSYKRHGFPLESFRFYFFKEDKYISRQIDEIGGGRNTIIAITMGQHFRQFPLQLYIRRALNIRKAIERLLTRSPDTKVIIKTENTRDTNKAVEKLSEFHGYCQYLVSKEVFKNMDVGFVDAMDMTCALATENIHPPTHVLENIMSLTFNYAC
ncbi:NXPE family member 4-like [Lissotriton helveticus]